MRFKVAFNGRLGNQMFQYAFGLSLSRKYSCELFLENRKNLSIHSVFGISLEEEGYEWKNVNERGHYKKGCERNFEALEEDNYRLVGYWQNENYFLDYKEEIKSVYRVPKFDIPENDLVVQVRRGDYVNNKLHFYCDVPWYEKAMSQFDYNKLHIITDDRNWCIESFKEYDPIVPDLKEKESIGYISSFKNVIISNSTFGWWGAYLSDTENVVCPKVWIPGKPKWETAKSTWRKL